MRYAERLLDTIQDEEIARIVRRVAERDEECAKLWNSWHEAIVRQRETREKKKFELSERQKATIARYEADAIEASQDIVNRLKNESDVKKLDLIMLFQMEAVVSDEGFWSDLLSGRPRSEFRRMQRFRIATVDEVLSISTLSLGLIGDTLPKFNEIRDAYKII